ncbi:hypothetical protein FRC12_013247 [Ceratobasidium sp. 428]|nr:hypothetical protein FRC12_013247 [Ceratobasidium sp. 428]
MRDNTLQTSLEDPKHPMTKPHILSPALGLPTGLLRGFARPTLRLGSLRSGGSIAEREEGDARECVGEALPCFPTPATGALPVRNTRTWSPEQAAPGSIGPRTYACSAGSTVPYPIGRRVCSLDYRTDQPRYARVVYRHRNRNRHGVSSQPARNTNFGVGRKNKLPNPAVQTRDPASSVMTTWLLPLTSPAHSTPRLLNEFAPSSVRHPSLTSILPNIRCVCLSARDGQLKQAWIAYATFCGLDGDGEKESGCVRGACEAALGGWRKHDESGYMEGIRDEGGQYGYAQELRRRQDETGCVWRDAGGLGRTWDGRLDWGGQEEDDAGLDVDRDGVGHLERPGWEA